MMKLQHGSTPKTYHLLTQFRRALRRGEHGGKSAGLLGCASRLKLPLPLASIPFEHLAHGIPSVEMRLVSTAGGEPPPSWNHLPSGIEGRSAIGSHGVFDHHPPSLTRLHHWKNSKIRAAHAGPAGVIMSESKNR